MFGGIEFEHVLESCDLYAAEDYEFDESKECKIYRINMSLHEMKNSLHPSQNHEQVGVKNSDLARNQIFRRKICKMNGLFENMH